MLHNGLFRCHGNICYVIFIDACFCKVHSVTDIGFGSIRQTLRNIEHHLLNSMSPGEHPLRVGT